MTTTRTTSGTAIEAALRTALSSLLHEQADPDCTGDPSYFVTQAQAESLVDRVMQTPIVQNALEKPHIQAFVNGNVIEAGPDEYREVYYEPCPTPAEWCEDEHHHYGRGDHLIPVRPGLEPVVTTTGTDPRAPLQDWEVLDVLVKYGGERIVAGPQMDALIADLVLLVNEGRMAVHERWREQEAEARG